MPISYLRHPAGALLVLGGVVLSGCAPALEQLEASFARDAHVLAPQAPSASDGWAVATAGDLTMAVRWVGRAKPLVTAYDPLGRVSRYVVPYTRKTWLIELKVTNHGQTPVTIKSSDWQLLTRPGGERRAPLALDFFKTHWPTDAVRSEAMMLDQSLAIGHVIRTLWQERELAPGDSARGILAFRQGAEPPQAAQLRWLGPQALTFAFGRAAQ